MKQLAKNFFFRRIFEFDESDRPLVLQLAGHRPEPIIELANLELYVESLLDKRYLHVLHAFSLFLSIPLPDTGRFQRHIDMLDINCGTYCLAFLRFLLHFLLSFSHHLTYYAASFDISIYESPDSGCPQPFAMERGIAFTPCARHSFFLS